MAKAGAAATAELWICDFCTIASFANYEEAEAHEAVCSSRKRKPAQLNDAPPAPTPTPTPAVNSKAKNVMMNNYTSKMKTINTVKVRSSKQSRINSAVSKGKGKQGSIHLFLQSQSISKKVSDDDDEDDDVCSIVEDKDIVNADITAAKFAAEILEKRQIERKRNETKRKKQAISVNPFFLSASKKSKQPGVEISPFPDRISDADESNIDSVEGTKSNIDSDSKMKGMTDYKPKPMFKIFCGEETKKIGRRSCSLSCSSSSNSSQETRSKMVTSKITPDSASNEYIFFPNPSHLGDLLISDGTVCHARQSSSNHDEINVEELMPDPMERICEAYGDSNMIDISFDSPDDDPLIGQDEFQGYLQEQLEQLNEDKWKNHLEYVKSQWASMCGADFIKSSRSILEVGKVSFVF